MSGHGYAVYPMKYAHGFIVLYFVVVILSVISESRAPIQYKDVILPV